MVSLLREIFPEMRERSFCDSAPGVGLLRWQEQVGDPIILIQIHWVKSPAASNGPQARRQVRQFEGRVSDVNEKRKTWSFPAIEPYVAAAWVTAIALAALLHARVPG